MAARKSKLGGRKAKKSLPRRRRPAATITPLQASRIVKKAAASQKIRVELTDEQLQLLISRWNEMDPKKPAQVTFVVQGKPMSEFTVASYRYRGDTCCV